MAKYVYDVALSFAGEDRLHAEKLANLLESEDIKVFYDNNEESDLWGENLYTALADKYSVESRFCVIFVSKHYFKKLWTNHERNFAQARAFKEDNAYILPIKLDDTEIPGIPATIGIIDLRVTALEKICSTLIKKIENSKKKVIS